MVHTTEWCRLFILTRISSHSLLSSQLLLVCTCIAQKRSEKKDKINKQMMLALLGAVQRPLPPTLACTHAASTTNRNGPIFALAGESPSADDHGESFVASKEHESEPGEIAPRQLTGLIKNTRNVRDLVALHSTHAERFNVIHLSAAWMALGRHMAARSRGSASKSGYVRYRPMPASLHQELMPLMRQSASMAIDGELTGRELANVCYGVARSRIPESVQRKALLDVLARAAASRMRELKPQELSNTAWAYATAGHRAPQLFDALAAVVESRLTQPSLDEELSTFSPQELANVCWAFATAGHRHDKLFDALATAALTSMKDFNPQNMANTAVRGPLPTGNPDSSSPHASPHDLSHSHPLLTTRVLCPLRLLSASAAAVGLCDGAAPGPSSLRCPRRGGRGPDRRLHAAESRQRRLVVLNCGERGA